jgi:prophage regulatory protein
MMDKIKDVSNAMRASDTPPKRNNQRLAAANPTRLITRRELRTMVPFTPQHILRLEKKGKFPRRVRLGENRVAWLLTEIETWIAERMAERDGIVR